MSGQPYASQPPLWLEAVFYVVLLLAAEFICMALWFNTGVQMDWIDHRDPGRPLPILFQWLSRCRQLLLFVPVPWVIFGVAGMKFGRRSDFRRLVFASTLILSLLALSLVVLTALTMPHIEIIKAVGR